MVLVKIIATVFVAVGPLLAQRGYRWYAEKGIDELRLRDPSEVTSIRKGSEMSLYLGRGNQLSSPNGNLDDYIDTKNTLERGDIAFRPLCWAIEDRRDIDGEITKIILVSGKIIEAERHWNMGIPVGGSFDDNVVVYVEYMEIEGEKRVSKKKPILYQPVDARETAKLTKLQEWIRGQAITVGEAATFLFVGVWTVVTMW